MANHNLISAGALNIRETTIRQKLNSPLSMASTLDVRDETVRVSVNHNALKMGDIIVKPRNFPLEWNWNHLNQ